MRKASLESRIERLENVVKMLSSSLVELVSANELKFSADFCEGCSNRLENNEDSYCEVCLDQIGDNE